MKTRACSVRLAVLPLACAAAFPVLSQTTNVLPETVVTATRSQVAVTDGETWRPVSFDFDSGNVLKD